MYILFRLSLTLLHFLQFLFCKNIHDIKINIEILKIKIKIEIIWIFNYFVLIDVNDNITYFI
jgi:hypothetical protein